MVSDQQVGDIEAVRLDMLRRIASRGWPDQRVRRLWRRRPRPTVRLRARRPRAPAAAGVHRRSRPVTARRTGLLPDFANYNPMAARRWRPGCKRILRRARPGGERVVPAGSRRSRPARGHQLRTAQGLAGGRWLWTYELSPRRNLGMLAYVVHAPSSLMARVRWFELVGADLVRYQRDDRFNLLYELSTVALDDMLAWHRRHRIAPMRFEIDRRFAGDVPDHQGAAGRGVRRRVQRAVARGLSARAAALRRGRPSTHRRQVPDGPSGWASCRAGSQARMAASLAYRAKP